MKSKKLVPIILMVLLFFIGMLIGAYAGRVVGEEVGYTRGHSKCQADCVESIKKVKDQSIKAQHYIQEQCLENMARIRKAIRSNE